MERGQSLQRQVLLRQQHPDFTGAVEVPRDIGRPRTLAAEQVDAASLDGLSRILRQPDAEKRRGRDGPSSTGEEGSGIFTSKASTEPSGKVVRSTASETIELSGDPMLPTGPDVMLPEEVSGPLRKKM